MSKRKRVTKSSTGADQPAGDESAASAADDAPKEDMAHVSPDVLAGSPDIFAPKWTDEPAAAPAPEARHRAGGHRSRGRAARKCRSAGRDAGRNAGEPAPALAPPAGAMPLRHLITSRPRFAPRERAAAAPAMALGIVLVVVGLFALGVVVFGIDLTQYGWPLFVIIPGLTLLVVGFVGGGVGASVPGWHRHDAWTRARVSEQQRRLG